MEYKLEKKFISDERGLAGVNNCCIGKGFQPPLCLLANPADLRG